MESTTELFNVRERRVDMDNIIDSLRREDKFLDFVKEQALKMGKVFFINSGEGRDEIVGDMYVEDLSGWLIDKKDEKEFEEQWKNGIDNISSIFDKNFVFVIWRKDNNKIQIEFKKYN